jgi:hypothetical protein
LHIATPAPTHPPNSIRALTNRVTHPCRKHTEAISVTVDHVDGSGMSWRQKFEGFVDFLFNRCSLDERRLFLEAAQITKTGRIRVEQDEDEDTGAGSAQATLANVQSATGRTRRDIRSRLTRAFNTPFFPDILVCSQVMAEGVDLQRFCRHVVHHDLDWNPSSIEQRTGRIDRLGCKAEGRQPIVVYLPYLAGTADERQYRVMSEREQWFRVVMGQDEVARLITPDDAPPVPLAAAQLFDSVNTQLTKLEEIDAAEVNAHRVVWDRRGKAVKSLEKAHGNLRFEVQRIVGALNPAEDL